jgi:hypothetical protein
VPRALAKRSLGVPEERAQAAPLSVPALCALIHPPEDVAEAACDVRGDVQIECLPCLTRERGIRRLIQDGKWG